MKLLSKIFIIIVMIFSLISPRIVFASEEKTYGKVYYLDSHISKNDGNGLSEENAFNSLEDINNLMLQPGDKVLIKAGSQFTGTLWPKGSGCAGYPIVIDMYGEGNKPIIDANGSYFMPQVKNWKGAFTGQNGDQIGAAVYLYNQEYIEINNLDVKNTGDNVNRDRSGIRIEGYDYGQINHIYIRNCDSHDVRGYNGQDDIYPVVPTNPDGSPLDGYVGGDQSNPNTSNTFWGARTTHRTGGINLVTYTARETEAPNDFNVAVQELDTTKKVTTFNDVLIENNKIENCQANGITTTNVKGTLDDVDFRHTNVIIRNNYIHNVTRAGIIPLYTSGVIVEHNKVDTFQSTLEGYGCGIWCDRANGMIFQYNEVCNGQNGKDGMAFNLDDMTRDGVIQYNYTHDNYGGGYMLHVRQKSYNRNNTIRYNLSVNDSGAFLDYNAQIVAVGETDVTKLESAKVYNNTFISNKDCHAVFEGDEVNYNNNIWYFTNPTVAGRNQCFQPGKNSTFDNNAYIGCIAPQDDNQYTDDPQFVGGNSLFNLSQKNAFSKIALKTTSPYINKSINVSGNGQQDILGQPLTSYNLGAIAGPGHNVKEIPQAQTVKADDNNVKRYFSDGTLQTVVIQESVLEADTKWVNTTFNDEPVIYTKKLNNYLEIPFTGTGGTMKFKRGAGAGNVRVDVFEKGNLSTPVKTVNYNTYNASADVVTINDLQGLSSDNKDYIVKVYNNENGKASNFMSLTSEVASGSDMQPGCQNDKVVGIVIEKPTLLTIPFGKSDASIAMNAHTYMDTCYPQDVTIPVQYSINNGGQVKDHILTVTQPGQYKVTASATYNGNTVTATTTLIVEEGHEPQVNEEPLHTKTLENLIHNCQSLNLNDFILDKQDVFKKQLNEAIELLKKNNLTQNQIDKMVDSLSQAKKQLIQIRFDAEDSAINRTGNWVEINEETLDKGTALKSGATDEKLSLMINGNEVSVYGRKAVGTGTVRFVITDLKDNREEQIISEDIDCYSETKKDKELLFHWKQEDNGNYRLDIINTGQKNSIATNRDTNAIIDYIHVERANIETLEKTALMELINEYQKINFNQYQDNQYKSDFITQLVHAKNLLISATTQSQLDDMVITLKTAKEAMLLKESTTVPSDHVNIKQEGKFTLENNALVTNEKGAKLSFAFYGDGIELSVGQTAQTGLIKVTLYTIKNQKEEVLKTETIDTRLTNKRSMTNPHILFAYYGVNGEYRIECENLDITQMIINGFQIIGEYKAVVNKADLEKKISKIEKENISSQQYTKSSYEAFIKALNKAKDTVASSDNQQVINDTLTELTTAYNQLVRVYIIRFEFFNKQIKEFKISAGSSFKEEIDEKWPNDSRTGYQFDGWKIKGSHDLFESSSPITQDIVLVPSLSAIQYAINYYDGSVVTTERFTVEDQIHLKTPTKKGYKFIGWYNNQKFEGQAITQISQRIGNIDLYAKWQKLDNIENKLPEKSQNDSVETADTFNFLGYALLFVITGLGSLYLRKRYLKSMKSSKN